MIDLFLFLFFVAVFCAFLVLGLIVVHLSATLARSWREGLPRAATRRRKP